MLYRFRTRVSRKFGFTNAHIKVLLGLVFCFGFWVFFSKLSKVLVFAQLQYSCVYTTVLEHLQKLYCTLMQEQKVFFCIKSLPC